MNTFQFFKPKNLNEAILLLSDLQDKNVMILSGGTDFIPKWKDGIIKPDFVVEIFGIDDLKEVNIGEQEIFIGSAVTFSEMLESETLKKNVPVLIEAVSKIGSPQIRSRATIGGNVANASPAGDSIPPLYVLDAKVSIASNSSERIISIEDFFIGPGKSVLNKAEIIKGFFVRKMTEKEKGRFLKIGQRYAMAISKVSVTALWELDSDKIKKIKIAYGAVSPTVIRAYKTEEFLSGKEISGDVIKEAMKIVSEEVFPITDIRSTKEYRREVAGILLKRVLFY